MPLFLKPCSLQIVVQFQCGGNFVDKVTHFAEAAITSVPVSHFLREWTVLHCWHGSLSLSAGATIVMTSDWAQPFCDHKTCHYHPFLLLPPQPLWNAPLDDVPWRKILLIYPDVLAKGINLFCVSMLLCFHIINKEYIIYLHAGATGGALHAVICVRAIAYWTECTILQWKSMGPKSHKNNCPKIFPVPFERQAISATWQITWTAVIQINAILCLGILQGFCLGVNKT